MKCKHGINTHVSTENWVRCVLDKDFVSKQTLLLNSYGKRWHRFFYKEKEYSWEEILRICELKVFL